MGIETTYSGGYLSSKRFWNLNVVFHFLVSHIHTPEKKNRKSVKLDLYCLLMPTHLYDNEYWWIALEIRHCFSCVCVCVCACLIWSCSSEKFGTRPYLLNVYWFLGHYIVIKIGSMIYARKSEKEKESENGRDSDSTEQTQFRLLYLELRRRRIWFLSNKRRYMIAQPKIALILIVSYSLIYR